MESLSPEEFNAPLSGTSVYFMSINDSSKRYTQLQTWQNLTKKTSITMALWGTNQMRSFTEEMYLKVRVPELKGPNGTPTLTGMQMHPSLQDSKIVSLKDSLENANGKLKTQEEPKTQDDKIESFFI